MKNLRTIALAVITILSTTAVVAQTKKINVSTSKIEWIGEKVTGKHNGTVNFKDGDIVFTKKKITGGSFTVDMASMTATDITGEYRDKLNVHLKNDDFFGTNTFPTAMLVFKTVTAKSPTIYAVTADLTIKGITKLVIFDMTVVGTTATTKFMVDRTKYDIRYGSKSFFASIGDKAIYDNFELAVTLKY